MKKSLKEHRISRQLSQQELAEKSGISIRTIQRIEKKNSAGSPYIIKSLCKALQVEVADIEFSTPEPEIIETNLHTKPEHFDINNEQYRIKRILKLVNFSSVSVLIFPLLSLIIPSLVYWKNRNYLRSNTAAQKIMSFQFIWTFSTMIVVFFIPAISQLFYGMIEFSGFPLFVWLYLVCVFFNLFVIFSIAIKINKSEEILPFVPNIL